MDSQILPEPILLVGSHRSKGRVLFVKLLTWTLTLQFIAAVTLLTLLPYLFRSIGIIGTAVSLYQFYWIRTIHIAF